VDGKHPPRISQTNPPRPSPNFSYDIARLHISPFSMIGDDNGSPSPPSNPTHISIYDIDIELGPRYYIYIYIYIYIALAPLLPLL
jgi:hypothetical protein